MHHIRERDDEKGLPAYAPTYPTYLRLPTYAPTYPTQNVILKGTHSIREHILPTYLRILPTYADRRGVLEKEPKTL